MNLEKSLYLTIAVALILALGLYIFLSDEQPEGDTLSDILDGESLSVSEKKVRYPEAIEISSPDGFVNTDGKEITLEELRGDKVVLLDIWTYSCINCQRTIPYLNDWYEKYKDSGLEIIGLHTPEFSFEKVLGNVEEAVERFGIKYPVVLDNDYSTWRAYGNQYWPRKYLIDIDGFIVYDHIGEGGYEETERAIQRALSERNKKLGLDVPISGDIADPEGKFIVESSKVESPEIYFGSSRNERLANGRVGVSLRQTLEIPSDISLNSLYLGGVWNVEPEYAENIGVGEIVFKYRAKDVYFVGSSDGGVLVEVYKDDDLLKTITVKEEKLYHLIEGEDYGEHTLKLEIKNSGLEAFTFTFG